MSAIAVVVLLAATRAWACLRVQASWRAAIGPSWEWAAASAAVVLACLALVRGQLQLVSPQDGLALASSFVFELGLGTVIGLLASLPGWALVGAGRQSEEVLELRALQDSASGGALTRLVVAASLCVGLGLGLHAPLIAGLLGLFDRFALAQPGEWLGAASASVLVEAAIAMTVLALALATPVLLTRVLVALCLVSLGRADPSRSGSSGSGAAGLVAVVGPGLRLSAALVALGAAWSTYPEAFARGM